MSTYQTEMRETYICTRDEDTNIPNSGEIDNVSKHWDKMPRFGNNLRILWSLLRIQQCKEFHLRHVCGHQWASNFPFGTKMFISYYINVWIKWQNYWTSTFPVSSGNPLHTWTDDQTGGRLADRTNSVSYYQPLVRVYTRWWQTMYTHFAVFANTRCVVSGD